MFPVTNNDWVPVTSVQAFELCPGLTVACNFTSVSSNVRGDIFVIVNMKLLA